MQISYARCNKYALVRQMLAGKHGTLLDVGARDRVLRSYLEGSEIQYFSSDLSPGHDYAFNLEKHVPLPIGSFDFVAALDVLEHVEGIHSALSELMRLARQMVLVSLPNLNSIKYRVRYLFTGRINGKYLLLSEHQGDRHRWLPVYADIYPFVTINAEQAHFTPVAAFNLIEYGGPLQIIKLLSRGAAMADWMADGLFTSTVFFALQRREDANDLCGSSAPHKV